MSSLRRWRAAAWAAGVALLMVAAGAYWLLTRIPELPPPAPGPAPELVARLARGVNLSNWLQHGRPTEATRYAPDAADWRLIRELGFLHVRILVDPDAFVGERGLPRPEALVELHAAVEDAVRADLAVVIALQLPSPLKQRLARSEADRQALAGLWRALGAVLHSIPPQQLLLEPINETESGQPWSSRRLQEFLAAQLRVLLPDHTLVASGHRYAGVEELAALEPLADRNVVYGFHFYEPHNFTHQGATWGPPLWRELRDFPYPSSPARVAPLLAGAAPAARGALKWHGEQEWNAERIGALIDRAARWGRQHQAAVWCGEFGVLRPRVAAADRAAWLRDVREALEARGIGWTHWDYAGDFGVVTGTRGMRQPDPVVMEALGLALPRAP